MIDKDGYIILKLIDLVKITDKINNPFIQNPITKKIIYKKNLEPYKNECY